MSQKRDENTNSMDRRNFLKLTGSSAMAGIAAVAIPNSLQAGQGGDIFKPGPHWHAAGFWKRVQKAFVLDPHKVYMNIGTTGSMPRHVLKKYTHYNHIVAKDPWDMGGEFGEWPHTTEMAATIAPQFGADPDEIVLSRNTTDGMCTILGGLQFGPGDEILATHHEHVAAVSPLTVIADRFGATVKYLEIPVWPTSEDEFVDLFESNINSNTKLIVFSHVTYKTGARLPAKKICQMAQNYGVPTLVDGAHTPGMLNLDFHDIGCDFYACSGHKWQCGPGATGIIYFKKDSPALDNYYAINSSLYPYVGVFGLSTALQYIGNDNYPAKKALVDSCEMWNAIGRDRIETYVLSLSSHCKQRIAQTFGAATLFAPDIPELSSGLTTFNPFADVTDSAKIVEFRDRLREEYGYIIRYTDFKILNSDPHETYAMRISTHLFHDFGQVDGLVEAMYDLYLKMA